MANINGIIGYNDQSGAINKLLAAYGNDIINVSTGLGYALNLDATKKVRFATLLNAIFFQNFSEIPKTFDGTSWSKKHVSRTPLSQYIKTYKNRIYLGNCKFGDPQSITDSNSNPLTFPNRVFFSDLYNGNELTWGLDWGVGGETSSNYFYLSGIGLYIHDLRAANIKVGDPFYLTLSDPVSNIGRYFISELPDPYRLRVVNNFPVNGLDHQSCWWVGSNWFDIEEAVTGFGENNDRLLIFSLFSLSYYTTTQLKKVSGAVGTSSQESVINDRFGNTYYFHGSDLGKTGIYRFDGVRSLKISRAVDAFIQGMSSSNYSSVVAWEEGNELRFFVGDLANTKENISMTNAVVTYNTVTQAWDVSPIADVITCSTPWTVSNAQNFYCGTNDNQIIKMNTGNNFNGTPIAAVVETYPLYPEGSEVQTMIPYIQALAKNGKGLRISYKLWNSPKTIDDKWKPLGELSSDLTEFEPDPRNRTTAGIQFRIEEDGSLANNWLFEKIAVFHKSDRTRIQ